MDLIVINMWIPYIESKDTFVFREVHTSLVVTASQIMKNTCKQDIG